MNPEREYLIFCELCGEFDWSVGRVAMERFADRHALAEHGDGLAVKVTFEFIACSRSRVRS